MSVSRRRAVLSCLTTIALSTVALTGCSGGGGGQADAAGPATATATATASASASASGGGTEPEVSSAPTSEAPWAGSKQFVQIDDAWIKNGRTYLSVRPAQKKAMTQPHEAWITVPGEGPFTTVTMTEDARVLLSVPLGDAGKHSAPYSQAEFVSRLADLSPVSLARVGYDLSFDGEGQVTRLKSLYTS